MILNRQTANSQRDAGLCCVIPGHVCKESPYAEHTNLSLVTCRLLIHLKLGTWLNKQLDHHSVGTHCCRFSIQFHFTMRSLPTEYMIVKDCHGKYMANKLCHQCHRHCWLLNGTAVIGKSVNKRTSLTGATCHMTDVQISYQLCNCSLSVLHGKGQ